MRSEMSGKSEQKELTGRRRRTMRAAGRALENVHAGKRGHLRNNFLQAHAEIGETLKLAHAAGGNSMLARGIAYVIFDRLEKMFGGAPSRSPEADCARRAALIISGAIDKLPLDNLQEYHSVHHYLDMTLVNTVLTAADYQDGLKGRDPDRLTLDDLKDAFVFGLLHDYKNPGGSNTSLFQFEKITWKEAEPMLIEAGYIGGRLKRMHTMLLATDPVAGPPLVAMAMRFHLSSSEDERRALRTQSKAFAARHGNGKDLKTVRSALFEDARTARMAYIATKADIAFSVLTPETHLENTGKFDREHVARQTGLRFLDEAGKLLEGGSRYFWNKIVNVTDRADPVPAVEQIWAGAARATMERVFAKFERESPEGDGPQPKTPGKSPGAWRSREAAENSKK